MRIHQLKSYFDGRRKILFFTVAFCVVATVTSIVYGSSFPIIIPYSWLHRQFLSKPLGITTALRK